MEIVYEDDAVLTAAAILDALAIFGFHEAGQQVVSAQRSLERQLPHFSELGLTLSRSYDFETAIRFFFRDLSGIELLSSRGFALLEMHQSGNKKYRPILSRAIQEAADDTQQRHFSCKTPLNVIAGVSVLHHLLVEPRRNFDAADQIFRSVLGTELHIVDESGSTIYGPKDYSNDALGEDAFWQFFEVARNEFRIPTSTPSNVLSLYDLLATNSPDGVLEIQARMIGQQTMSELRQDRNAK